MKNLSWNYFLILKNLFKQTVAFSFCYATVKEKSKYLWSEVVLALLVSCGLVFMFLT